MATTINYEEGTTRLEVIIDKPLTKVTARFLDYNVKGVGYARWDEADEYDEAFGVNLASTRALFRAHHNAERRLIASTK